MSKALVAAGVATIALGALLLLRTSGEPREERRVYLEASPSCPLSCRFGYLLLSLGFLAQAVGTYLP